MYMGTLSGTVEDHDQLGRAVQGGDRVRDHRRELRCLSCGDIDTPVSQPQPYAPFQYEEPVMTWVHPPAGRLLGRLKADLHRDRTPVRTAQRPCRPCAAAVCDRTNDDVVIGGHLEECAETQLKGVGQRNEHIETQRALSSLHTADG